MKQKRESQRNLLLVRALAIGILQQTELAFSLFNINRMATGIHHPGSHPGRSLICDCDFDWLHASGLSLMHLQKYFCIFKKTSIRHDGQGTLLSMT